MSSTGSGVRRRRRGYAPEPEDAHRGFINPTPQHQEEAGADREMAGAARAVTSGTATEEQAGVSKTPPRLGPTRSGGAAGWAADDPVGAVATVRGAGKPADGSTPRRFS